MAIKFDFNKLRTAVKSWTAGVDLAKGSLTAGEEAMYTPHMRHARPVEHISNASAVTRTLLDAESGTLFICGMTAVDNNVTLTLPTAAGSAGIYFDFIINVASDDDADLIITTGLDATDIYGTIDTLAAVSTNLIVNGKSAITVDGSVEQTVGVRLNLLCDGIHWHLTGHTPKLVGTPHITSATAA